MFATTNPPRAVTREVLLPYTNIFEAEPIQGGKLKFSASLFIPKSGLEPLARIKRADDAVIDDGNDKFGGKRPNKAALKFQLRDSEPFGSDHISDTADFEGFGTASDDFLN